MYPPPLLRARFRTAGSTLPATMMVVAVILAFLSAAALLTSQDARFAGRQEGKSDMLTAADAALEYAYGQWKASVTTTVHGNKTSVPAASLWPASTLLSNFNAAYANSGAFAASTGVVVSALSINSTDQNGQPILDPTQNSKDVSSTAAPTGVATSNVPGYPGWGGTTYNYVASVTVGNPNHYAFSSSDAAVTVKRYFQVTSVPLFQAAIFYENDLEIHPGAKMVVTGLVHTNANLYSLGIGAQVQFMSNVSYVGTQTQGSNPAVTHGWDGQNGANYSPEFYDNYYFGPEPNLWKDGLPTPTTGSTTGSTTYASQLNQVSTIDPFGGASQSNNGLHDIVEVPAANNTSDQVAYNNASLKIIVDSSIPPNNPHRYLITDGTNTPLTDPDRQNVINALTATAPTTIFDQREYATVTVTSVDMAKLAVATVPAVTLNATNEMTTPVLSGTNLDGTNQANGTTFQKNFQGTVYIHDVAPTVASTRTAIRLVNGRELGQNVSVATDNGLYIQGDYNTGGNVPGDVPSNVGDPTRIQASNYSRHSSSVMADAVTILSNSWSDGNSSAVVGSRNATATTVNTGILAGDVPSNAGGDGIASGGAHNFPRFLETWSNINFTYTGSLVEAFRSEKFTGSWQTKNVYTWPNRLWSFDTNFLTKQPPGVPTGIQFSRGRYERAVN